MAGKEIVVLGLGARSGPVVGVYKAAQHTKFAKKIPVALRQEQGYSFCCLISLLCCHLFLRNLRCAFDVAVNTDVGSARNDQALCTQPSRWEHASEV